MVRRNCLIPLLFPTLRTLYLKPCVARAAAEGWSLGVVGGHMVV